MIITTEEKMCEIIKEALLDWDENIEIQTSSRNKGLYIELDSIDSAEFELIVVRM